jgi:hypothetical protein
MRQSRPQQPHGRLALAMGTSPMCAECMTGRCLPSEGPAGSFAFEPRGRWRRTWRCQGTRRRLPASRRLAGRVCSRVPLTAQSLHATRRRGRWCVCGGCRRRPAAARELLPGRIWRWRTETASLCSTGERREARWGWSPTTTGMASAANEACAQPSTAFGVQVLTDLVQ